MELGHRNINNNELTTDKYTFSRADVFNYLRTEINMTDKMTDEIINKGPIAANMVTKKLLSSKLIDKKMSLVLYNPVIRPILTSCSEKRPFRIFERKLLTEIYVDHQEILMAGGRCMNSNRSSRRGKIILNH